MVMEAEVQSALAEVNARYVDAAKLDILNALSEFCDLYAGTDSHVFNDGTSRKVVTLNGTIPITYKGSTYNIPVCLYLLDTHPYNAPICYVRPTSDMTIKPSRHVDVSGKITLPYLQEWVYPKSDLMGLLQIMVIIFGDSCPVFAKSSSSVTGSVGATADGAYIHNFGPSEQAVPGPYKAAHQVITTTPVGRPILPYGTSYGISGTSTSTVPNAYPSYAGFNASSTYVSSHVMGSSVPVEARMGLYAAIDEKLRTKLRDSIGTLYTELQSIRKTREDLNAGEQKLKSALEKMKEEQDHLDLSVVNLKYAVDLLDKILLEAGDADESQIDDAIDTTAPVFRQLLNSFVEDNAIEDTIYYLGEALKRGRMDLESYLKHVRVLSRQQFMLRATMQRCRQVAGVDK